MNLESIGLNKDNKPEESREGPKSGFVDYKRLSVREFLDSNGVNKEVFSEWIGNRSGWYREILNNLSVFEAPDRQSLLLYIFKSHGDSCKNLGSMLVGSYLKDIEHFDNKEEILKEVIKDNPEAALKLAVNLRDINNYSNKEELVIEIIKNKNVDGEYFFNNNWKVLSEYSNIEDIVIAIIKKRPSAIALFVDIFSSDLKGKFDWKSFFMTIAENHEELCLSLFCENFETIVEIPKIEEIIISISAKVRISNTIIRKHFLKLTTLSRGEDFIVDLINKTEVISDAIADVFHEVVKLSNKEEIIKAIVNKEGASGVCVLMRKVSFEDFSKLTNREELVRLAFSHSQVIEDAHSFVNIIMPRILEYKNGGDIVLKLVKENNLFALEIEQSYLEAISRFPKGEEIISAARKNSPKARERIERSKQERTE